MANPDRPNGFTPMGTTDGSPWNGRVRRYEAADRSADTTGNHGDIYVGDPVKLSSGKVLPANSGDQVTGVVVAVGTDTSINEQGFGPYNANNLTKRYLGYAESGYVWVAPANMCIFGVQSASDLDLVVGSAADTNIAAATAHGSQTTGMSTAELTTASNNDVVVVEIPLYPDNDPTLANARYLVQFSNVDFAQP